MQPKFGSLKFSFRNFIFWGGKLICLKLEQLYLIHFLMDCHELWFLWNCIYHVYMQPKFHSLMFRFGIYIFQDVNLVLVLVGHYFVWHIQVLLGIYSLQEAGGALSILGNVPVFTVCPPTPPDRAVYICPFCSPCIECPIQVRFSHRTWLPALLRKSRHAFVDDCARPRVPISVREFRVGGVKARIVLLAADDDAQRRVVPWILGIDALERLEYLGQLFFDHLSYWPCVRVCGSVGIVVVTGDRKRYL